MLNVQEFADAHQVTPARVIQWINEGRLAEAQQEPLPFARGEKYIWLIPEGTPRPEKGKPGPKAETTTTTTTTTKRAAKKAGNQ